MFLLTPPAITMTQPTPEIPSWFRQLPLGEGLIYGVGMGTDPASAEGDARRQVALRLSSSVRSEVTGKHIELVAPFASDALDQKASSYMVTTTISNLPSVAIVKREVAGGVHYALAELNVAKALNTLMESNAGAQVRLTRWLADYDILSVQQRLALSGVYRRDILELQRGSRLLTLLAPYCKGLETSPHLNSAFNTLLAAMAKPPLKRVHVVAGREGRETLTVALLSGGISVGDQHEDAILMLGETPESAMYYNVLAGSVALTMNLTLSDGTIIHSASTTVPSLGLTKGRRDFILQHLHEWLGISATPVGTEPLN